MNPVSAISEHGVRGSKTRAFVLGVLCNESKLLEDGALFREIGRVACSSMTTEAPEATTVEGPQPWRRISHAACADCGWTWTRRTYRSLRSSHRKRMKTQVARHLAEHPDHTVTAGTVHG
jgi:hypothetical protein